MKLLLIDGHYYVYRSFFAIQSLSNSRGEPTNAIYGFIKTVRRMLKDLNPALVAVLWDEGMPQRRVALQPAYKQTRAEMPDLMRPQLRIIQEEITPFMGFANIAVPDTEADDLMAAYTCAARRQDYEVVLATNDKDLFQLVDERIKVYTTNKADLPTPKETHALLGIEAVQKKWGVAPTQIADVLALIGDTVDNIPGVAGFGPKTAAGLIQEFGSVEKLLEELPKVKKDSVREKLAQAREQVMQNREMVRLETDLPLPVPLDRLQIKPDYPALLEVLRRCEFKTLLEEIRLESEKVLPVTTPRQSELF